MPVKRNSDGSTRAWMKSPYGDFDMVVDPDGEIMTATFKAQDKWKELKREAAAGPEERQPNFKTVGGMVTGMPRSGTSLGMRTVDLLGLTFSGQRFPADVWFNRRMADAMLVGDEDLADKIAAESTIYREKNPTGFYEGGMSDPALADKVAKVVFGSLAGVSACRGPIMICTRHPAEIATSVRRGVGVGLNNPAQAQAHYLSGAQAFAKWILGTEPAPAIEAIDYSEAITTPRDYVDRVASLFGVEPTDEAYSAVDQTLYRSAVGAEVYPESQMPVAMAAYDRIRVVRDWPSAVESARWIRENAKWLGDHLHDVLSEKWSAIPCPKCREEIIRLNGLSVDEAKARRDGVVADVAERAKIGAPSWWQRWCASIASGVVIKEIGKCYDEAVSRCEAAMA